MANEPVYSMPRPVSPYTGKECFAFQWIGQAFSSCDACGQPFWEHTHMRRQHPNDRLGWSLHKIISAPERAAVKAKWGGQL